ncbi:hypothetical protein BSKO_04211 [Bryopsis sp. KO-2023]|nr:hypothetical protein BSKO_04211 [Bryopsis sp. KO-2023]
MASTRVVPTAAKSYAPIRNGVPRPLRMKCSAVARSDSGNCADRRAVLGGGLLGVATLLSGSNPREARAESITSDLCGKDCLELINSSKLQTTASGLQYIDIKEGKGPTPPIGFQVVASYIAMTAEGRVFNSSFDSGKPFDIRVGAETLIPGLDEGILTMRTGGIRRLYIPGNLAFAKPLASAPGRARVLANTPVIFDVQLLYIPGVDVDDE